MDGNIKMNDKFNELYNKIINEDAYDSFSQRYWLEKSRETEQMRKNGELKLQEDEIELNGNEFEASLIQGAYEAHLEGTIEGNIIHWEVSDYNSDFDGPLGIEINGESEGTREIGEGQTAEMVLQNLYAEFKDAFKELDIDEYAEDDQEDGYQNEDGEE